MIKKLFIITIICSVAFAQVAKADFEFVEAILGKLESLEKEFQQVEEVKKEVEAAANEVRQGAAGAIAEVKKAEGVVGGVTSGSAIPNLAKVDVKMLSSLAATAEDKKGLEDVVSVDLTPNYTDKAQNKVFMEIEEKRQASRLRGALRLYAYSLTMRTNMAKTRKDENTLAESNELSADEVENSREILKLSNKETTEAARRLSQIWDMQAALLELEMLDAIKGYSVDLRGEDEEQGDLK